MVEVKKLIKMQESDSTKLMSQLKAKDKELELLRRQVKALENSQKELVQNFEGKVVGLNKKIEAQAVEMDHMQAIVLEKLTESQKYLEE